MLIVLAELFGRHMHTGMMRFYFTHESERDRKAVVSSATLAVGAAAWVVTLVALPFREELAPILLAKGDEHVGPERLVGLLALTLLVFPLNLTTQAGMVYLQIQKRSALFSGIQLSKMLTELALKIVLMGVFDMGVEGWFLSIVVGEALGTLFLTGWVVRTVGLRIDWRVLRPILVFTLPLIPVGVAQLGIHQLDRRLLEHLSASDGLKWAGIYGLGYTVGSLANQVVTNSFFQIWQPTVYGEADERVRASLVARVTTYALVALAAASLGLIVFGREAVVVLTSRPGYEQAYRVVPWVASGYVFWALYASAQLTLYAAHRPRPLVWVNLGALAVNVALNVWLIPAYGYVGAAVATVATYAVLSALALQVGRRAAPVPFEWGRLGTVVAIVAATSASVVALDARTEGLAAGTVLAKTVLLPAALAALWFAVLRTGERVEFRAWAARRLSRRGTRPTS